MTEEAKEKKRKRLTRKIEGGEERKRKGGVSAVAVTQTSHEKPEGSDRCTWVNRATALAAVTCQPVRRRRGVGVVDGRASGWRVVVLLIRSG